MSTTRHDTTEQIAARAARAAASHKREIERLMRLLNETEKALAMADAEVIRLEAKVERTRIDTLREVHMAMPGWLDDLAAHPRRTDPTPRRDPAERG